MTYIYGFTCKGWLKCLTDYSKYTRVLGCFFFLFAFLLTGTVQGQENRCHESLAHHFALDEKEPGTYLDSKRGVQATCTDCPTPVDGLFAGAQSFDGANDGLTIKETAAFEWGPNSNFTIELWVKTTAKPSNNQIMIGRKAKEHGMIWWIGMDKEGRAVFALWDNRGEGANIGYGTKKINDGKWHHIAVVRDGRTRRSKLYVDGFITASFDVNYDGGYMDKSTSPVTIGYLELESGYRFKGELDEIMVYRNYAFTETEMRARYNSGNGNYCGTKQFAPAIMSEPVTYGTVGQQYTYDVQATGSPAPAFSIVSGPQGLVINATTGVITWGPAAPGSFEVKVKASNSIGEDQQTFRIEVRKSISKVSGLLHHWMMHELSGTEYKDYYSPHHALSVGASKPEPISGVISGGQRFDGTEDALDVTGSKNFDWKPNSSFTIELWMRTSVGTSTNRVLIGRQAMDSPVHWWMGVSSAGLARFVLFDLEYKGIFIGDAGPRLDDGVWHQLVAVRDGASGITKLYVDGEQIASDSYTHAVGFESRSPVNIGYLGGQDPSYNGYRYEGDMDEIKLFGRPLSADEVRKNYNDVFNAIMDLVKFEGVYRNGVVVLNWETLNEVNCESFTVERSADMENFEAIGEVQAAGNSTQKLAYSFTDKEPLKEDAYYRLKINKTNGTYTYSNIILISYKGLVVTTFKVYPNPLQKNGQEVSIDIDNLVPDETILFFMSDLTGKRIIEQEFTVEPGGRLSFKVPVEVTNTLESGMYMLTIVTKIKKVTRKLMVVQ